MKIKPLYHILAKRLESKEEVRGGIIIPDTAKEKPQEAEIIEVGAGDLLHDKSGSRPLKVKKGDKILIGKYSGKEIKVGDEDLVFIQEEDILAIIEK